MNDEKLLKTIQNDIKNLDKCIDTCIDEEGINYLKTIKQILMEQEIEIVKRMAIKTIKQSMMVQEIEIVKRMPIKKALKELQKNRCQD